MCFTMRNKLTILKIISFTFERPTAHLEKLFASMSNKLCILQSPILPELISQYWQRIWIPNWIRICFSSKQVLKTHCLLFRVYQSAAVGLSDSRLRFGMYWNCLKRFIILLCFLLHKFKIILLGCTIPFVFRYIEKCVVYFKTIFAPKGEFC